MFFSSCSSSSSHSLSVSLSLLSNAFLPETGSPSVSLSSPPSFLIPSAESLRRLRKGESERPRSRERELERGRSSGEGRGTDATTEPSVAVASLVKEKVRDGILRCIQAVRWAWLVLRCGGRLGIDGMKERRRRLFASWSSLLRLIFVLQLPPPSPTQLVSRTTRTATYHRLDAANDGLNIPTSLEDVSMVLNETTAPALESVPEAVVAKASKVDAAPIFEEPDSLPSSSSPTPLAPLPTSHPKPRGQSTFDWFAPSPLRASHSKQSSLALGSNGGDGTGGDGEGEEHEFRGAFTEDDTERGARFMRSASTDTEQLDTVREGEGPSSTPMAKGRKTRETAGGDSQWEDATQDGAAVATEGQTPKRPFVGRASSSLWSPAGRKKGMGGVVNDAVAAATEGSPTGKAKTKRGTQMRRATTGGWVAIRNKLKGTGSLTTAPANKTLTGHELIAVSLPIVCWELH